MTLTVPDKLKAADVSRFVQRAAQVEPHKPAVAYWAYYWTVQQILAKGLPNADDACKQFTTSLVDKLEQMKDQYASNEAISDDLAAQALIEQFGLEIFQRADNAVIANKATRVTGDNFWSAATFLDLLHIWGTPSPDISQKIKYAKVEAARILKAVKAGEDPNLTNPAITEQPDVSAPVLDPNDPDVQKINAAAQQPSVVDVPDEHHLPQQPSPSFQLLDQPSDPARAPSLPSIASPASLNGNVPAPNAPEGYFPQQATDQTQARVSPLDPQPAFSPPPSEPPERSFSPPRHIPSPNLASAPDDAQSFYTNAALPGHPPPPPAPAAPPMQPQQPAWPTSPPPAPVQQPAYVPYQQQPVQQPVPQQAPVQAYLTDDAAMTQGARHARFAISALNFDDVPTAVKELREALRALGAS